jgi:hypothetical protein
MKTQTVYSRPTRFQTAVRSAGLTALLTLGMVFAFAHTASAGCLQYDGAKNKLSDWRVPESSQGSARFIKADFRQVSDEEFAPLFVRAPITGLWAFKYTSKGNSGTLGIPDGAPIDSGNTIWFADGNEMTYSGMRDPTTGAVCLGVWVQTGEWTYELNHIGLSWNPLASPPAPGGPGFIKQYVTLDKSGNSYTGTFTISQLGTDGKTLALPAPIKGLITATRVTVNTDTQVP